MIESLVSSLLVLCIEHVTHDVSCFALFAAAVRVQASSDVTVHVVSVSDWSTGSYVALPLDELGSDYYVMTFSSNETRTLWQMCVVSLVDNTVVRLSLEARSSTLQPLSVGVDLHSTTNILLDKYQTFQVICLQYTVSSITVCGPSDKCETISTVDSTFYPSWDDKMTVSFRAE